MDEIRTTYNTYVGARYVPRFTGLYDVTQSYEALDVVDNGSGTSYIAKKPTPAGTPLTNTDYWFLYGSTNGAIINLQQQINDMKDGDVPGSLQNQIDDNTSDITALTTQIAITPDSIAINPTDDDYTKLQNAINYAIANKVNIRLNRSYDITGHTLSYAKGQYGGGTTRFKTCIFDGEIVKNDSGCIFTGIADSSDTYFINVSFVGGNNTYVFNSLMIRVFMDCCQFRGFYSLYEISSANSYIQTLKLSHCTATDMASFFVQCNGCYDVCIDSCVFETGYGAFKNFGTGAHPYVSNLVISNCCMESLTECVILTQVLNSELSDIFFEGNTQHHIYIEGNVESLLIKGCSLYGPIVNYHDTLIDVEDVYINKFIVISCFTLNGRILNNAASRAIKYIENRGILSNIGKYYDPFYKASYNANAITDIANGITVPLADFQISGNYCTFYIYMNMTGATFVTGDILMKLPVASVSDYYCFGATTSAESPIYHAYIDHNGNLKQYGGNNGDTYNNLIISGSFEIA